MDEQTLHTPEQLTPNQEVTAGEHSTGEYSAEATSQETGQLPQVESTTEHVSANETSNARGLRQAKERSDQRANQAEQRAMELERRLKIAEEAKNASLYEDDDLVNRKYVDQKNSEMQKQLAAMKTEHTLKSNYPDYEKVVNDDTIAQLKERNPTMALALSQIGDQYSQAAAVYETVRSMGIYQEDSYVKEREKAQANSNKPRPLQSLSPQKNDSPISQANAFAEGSLSEEYLAQLRKEMSQARKGY